LLFSVIIRFLGKGRTPDALAQAPDQELVRLYQRTQDLRAVSVLLDRYADVIAGIAMRQLRDEEAVRDFAGDLYLKLTDKLLNTEVVHVKSWLLTTVNNALTDLGRKARVRREYRERVRATSPVGTEVPSGMPLDQHYLTGALHTLSEREQRCVQYIYFQDLSYQEIMELEGWTFNQVRGMRDRAMKKLRQALGPEFQQYFQED